MMMKATTLVWAGVVEKSEKSISVGGNRVGVMGSSMQQDSKSSCGSIQNSEDQGTSQNWLVINCKGGKQPKMPQNDSKQLKTAQNGSKQLKMTQNP